ncbi:restriction endonuclease [Lysobacter soyae]|uniref:Restriction endonuclease n=1 Tax=Lysobacter soyae TaxID=2764185 RepID=A0ABX8WNE6_9GAMM|nr:restriction endonuclease [Lysobacter sp. CJ11]QYR52948.1 restriction endonuclease [Lysobacter sp. CJ11]
MSKETKLYLTRAGKLGEDEELALDNDLSIIGFRDIPSLESCNDYDSVFKIVEAQMPGAKPRAIGNRAGQLWAFSVAMKEGDLVVMPRKLTSQIAIGRVAGSYSYREINGELRHLRPVKWIRPDAPRTAFEQDLLHSLGAFMTVCNISRNDAERRVESILSGKPDPGLSLSIARTKITHPIAQPVDTEENLDLAQVAHDQIVAHIQTRFAGHALANLVDAVLKADGWVTKVSPPGADGGVDVLGGRGPLGLDNPRLCVQVKSQNSPADVTVYRTLQGTMQIFKADQGLLVCWGGFNKAVLSEAKQGHFAVRLWDSRDLVEAIYRTYESLPAEIQADLPLKRAWMLVQESTES